MPLAVVICAGLWLPGTPALAKTQYHYKYKYKARKFHVPKQYKAHHMKPGHAKVSKHG